MLKNFFCLLAIMILSACTNNNIQNENTPDNSKQEKVSAIPSDTLNLSMNTPKTFNPLINEDITVDKILRMTFEPIIKINNDNAIENILAQEITFDENYNANIKLRQDILWNDGTNLTAEDVLFSINQIKSANQNSIYKHIGEDIVSCQKISNYELNIKFKDKAYISSYLMDFPIIPKKYFANENDSLPICNGPYKFCTYTQMKNLTLEKNEQYFGQAPNFENIKVIIVPDNQTSIDAFNQKIINSIQTDAQNIGKFHKYTNKILIPTDELEFIFLNPANNLFNIKPLRDSLINILPIEEIRNDIYSDILSKSVFDTENTEHTKQIISEYKPEAPLKILVNAENNQRIKSALLIKKVLSDYGINSTVEKKNFDEYKAALQNKNFDIYIGGFVPEKKFGYEKLFSTENILGYKNENINEKWLKINSATTKTEFDNDIKNFNAALKDSQIIILGLKNEIQLTNNQNY